MFYFYIRLKLKALLFICTHDDKVTFIALYDIFHLDTYRGVFKYRPKDGYETFFL